LGGKAPEGWLDGPEAGQAFSYTNWGGVEPNNSGYLYMNIGTSFAGIGPGQWADDVPPGIPNPSTDPVIGYFVEYEGIQAVPEPSSCLLLAFGLAGLGAARWRRGRNGRGLVAAPPPARQDAGRSGGRRHDRPLDSPPRAAPADRLRAGFAQPGGVRDDRRAR
jgi:hypothetical protein